VTNNAVEPLTHVFISYSRQNKREVALARRALKKANLPFWDDSKIEANGKWIPQVDEALEDAFALVVVVTPESMQSQYVTYEWSWALGNSLPIFPLLMTGSYEDIHSRLLPEQVIDCRQGIPASVLEQIADRMIAPSDSLQLNRIINQTIMPFKLLSRLYNFLALEVEQDVEDLLSFRKITELMLEEGQTLFSSKLPELMIDKSHAFSSVQKRRCRTLTHELQKFYEIFRPPLSDRSPHFITKDPRQVFSAANEYWTAKLLNTLNYFEYTLTYDDSFVSFDTYLGAISSNVPILFRSLVLTAPHGAIRRHFTDYQIQDELSIVINRVLMRKIIAAS
jgi:hypothetical protein